MTYQDRIDEICDLVTDPGSEFYSLASWDESGRVAAYCTLNAPVAEEIVAEIDDPGIEAIDAHTLRVPYVEPATPHIRDDETRAEFVQRSAAFYNRSTDEPASTEIRPASCHCGSGKLPGIMRPNGWCCGECHNDFHYCPGPTK